MKILRGKDKKSPIKKTFFKKILWTLSFSYLIIFPILPSYGMVGTKAQLEEWAGAICQGFSPANGTTDFRPHNKPSENCKKAVDDCTTNLTNYLWDQILFNARCGEDGVFNFKCDDDAYLEILGDANTYATDNLSSSVVKTCLCGNGVLDPGELCDPLLPSSYPNNLLCAPLCRGYIIFDFHGVPPQPTRPPKIPSLKK